MNIDILNKKIAGKKVLILGFGKEGKSTYQFLRKYFKNQLFTIADNDINIRVKNTFDKNENLEFFLGDNYLECIKDFELIIKTPGISLKNLDKNLIKTLNISSQTDIFLELFAKQVIGITGTKGKSTTSSLIFKIIKSYTDNVILVGNIGIPPFELTEDINNETIIVYEMSSHQLENIKVSPHISILLNIYQEHLDHYQSYKDYQMAKFNIAMNQNENDYIIYNTDNQEINTLLNENSLKSQLIGFSLESEQKNGIFSANNNIYISENNSTNAFYNTDSERFLKGEHNLLNIMAAIYACKLKNIPDENILYGIKNFKGLEHRIEFVGEYENIRFYNDSISTIPEACIAAVNALKEVDTLILGGYDRGIDYSLLADFLIESEISNLIFVGKAGERIFDEIKNLGCFNKAFYEADSYEKIVETCFEVTQKGKICLLSPAASSYDMFKNFEERGNKFKELIRKQFNK